MSELVADSADTFSPVVQIDPSDIARRHITRWNGVQTDAVQVLRHEPFEYGLRASHHLLIMTECAERYDGETLVEGLPTSTLQNFSRKLSLVPAGHRFFGWQKPRLLTRVTYFYIDPRGPLIDPELRFAETELKPRLFFFDKDLWETAAKLKADVAKLSPYHFVRAFKQSFGLPPHRYMSSLRIEQAKSLLANPAVSVTQIGVNLGFSETSSFTSAFRKHTGLTPTAYRRSLE